MSEVKHVEINPDFLVGLKSKKSRTQKSKVSGVRLKPPELRKSLLEKIREHKLNANLKSRAASIQNRILPPAIQQPQPAIQQPQPVIQQPQPAIQQPQPAIQQPQKTTSPLDDEFSASLQFLQQISSKRNKKLKQAVRPNVLQTSFPLSPSNLVNNNMKMIISEKKDANDAEPSRMPGQSDGTIEPPYGCLKNSNKPTYRQWRSTHKNGDGDSVFLGKHGRTVKVLIKDSNTRRNIKSEHSNLMKLSKVHEMKKYLKNHNLIKPGSHAPVEVIRKMYEQAILSGDIINVNNDTVVQNLLSSE